MHLHLLNLIKLTHCSSGLGKYFTIWQSLLFILRSEIYAAAAVSAFGCQLKRCHLTVKRVNWAKPNKGISTKEGVCVTRFYALFKRNGPPFDTRTHFSTWQRGTNPFIVGSKISPYKYTYNAYNRYLKKVPSLVIFHAHLTFICIRLQFMQVARNAVLVNPG